MKQYIILEQVPISEADFNALAAATVKKLNSYGSHTIIAGKMMKTYISQKLIMLRAPPVYKRLIIMVSLF